MNAPIFEIWLPLGVSLLLLLLNALLVALELALIRVRFSHFEPELVERLTKRAPLAFLIEHADATVRVARFGMLLCTIGYAILLHPLGLQLATWAGGHWGSWVRPVAWGLCYFIAVGLFFVVGELVPRGLGLGYPRVALEVGRWVLKLMQPLRKPLVRPLSLLSNFILRLMGLKDKLGIETLDIEAQLELGDEKLPISTIARSVFRNALNLHDLVVSDVLLPRHQVQWMDINDSIDTNLQLARSTGHTRFPLCEGDLDRCLGLIHIKDIFRRGIDPKRLDLRKVKRDIVRLSPDQPVEEALQLLLNTRMHMALVVDEFRGAEGVITLERILELLVGDIRDEFDVEEDNIKQLPDGDYSVSGLARVYEVEQALDVEVENEDVSTFGGLVTAELGRIPTQGERLELEGLQVIVTEVDERRVIRMRVRKLEQPGEES